MIGTTFYHLRIRLSGKVNSIRCYELTFVRDKKKNRNLFAKAKKKIRFVTGKRQVQRSFGTRMSGVDQNDHRRKY